MSELKRQEVKGMADAIGMPDEKDKAFLITLLREYNKQFPGEIALAQKQAKDDLKVAAFGENGRLRTEYGVTGKAASMRLMFEFPENLVKMIEEYYPTLFREPKHFHWFIREFKGLMLPEKY